MRYGRYAGGLREWLKYFYSTDKKTKNVALLEIERAVDGGVCLKLGSAEEPQTEGWETGKPF